MIIRDEMNKRFPLCVRYIRNFLSDPDVIRSKYTGVWNAFIYACTIDLSSADAQSAENFARQALTFGKEPWVQLIDSKEVCGLFFPGLPSYGYGLQDIIQISYECADAYEHGTGWKVFEGGTLHELVHWVRCMAVGFDEFRYKYCSEGEVGSVFEMKAYGFPICVREKGKKRKKGKLIQYGPPDGP